jgi:hypothetical protein
MDKTLTHEAKVQLAGSLRRRYQAASSKAKKQMLSEFVAVSGYHPKYAIHLLNGAEPSAPARRGRVRPALYDDAAKQALIVLWEASDRVCGKRLRSRPGKWCTSGRLNDGCRPSGRQHLVHRPP